MTIIRTRHRPFELNSIFIAFLSFFPTKVDVSILDAPDCLRRVHEEEFNLAERDPLRAAKPAMARKAQVHQCFLAQLTFKVISNHSPGNCDRSTQGMHARFKI